MPSKTLSCFVCCCSLPPPFLSCCSSGVVCYLVFSSLPLTSLVPTLTFPSTSSSTSVNCVWYPIFVSSPYLFLLLFRLYISLSPLSSHLSLLSQAPVSSALCPYTSHMLMSIHTSHSYIHTSIDPLSLYTLSALSYIHIRLSIPFPRSRVERSGLYLSPLFSFFLWEWKVVFGSGVITYSSSVVARVLAYSLACSILLRHPFILTLTAILVCPKTPSRRPLVLRLLGFLFCSHTSDW